MWVEAVHGPAEEEELKRYSNLFNRRNEVHKAMDQGDRGRLRALVRDIDSVGVIITEKPETLFDGLAHEALSQFGFTVDPHHFAMLGRCADCS